MSGFWIQDCSVDGGGGAGAAAMGHSVSVFPGETSRSQNPEGGSFLPPGSPPWLVTSAENGKQRLGVRARGGALLGRLQPPLPAARGQQGRGQRKRGPAPGRVAATSGAPSLPSGVYNLVET